MPSFLPPDYHSPKGRVISTRAATTATRIRVARSFQAGERCLDRTKADHISMLEYFQFVRGQRHLAQPRLIATLEIFDREERFLDANPCVLARDGVRGVERREVDPRRGITPGIDPPDNHLVLCDCDALHNLLLILQNVEKNEGVVMAASGVNRVGTLIRVNTACLTDLFDAFGSEVDRGGLAVFRGAHLQPASRVFSDAICESAQRITWCGTRIPRLPVRKDAGAVANHLVIAPPLVRKCPLPKKSPTTTPLAAIRGSSPTRSTRLNAGLSRRRPDIQSWLQRGRR